MSATASKPAAYLSFTLHAHLPYVVNHGTWPHGIEWLLEAVAETYLPLLRVLGNLERDGLALRCNLNLSPILLEQLAHPTFQAEFPRYLDRKIAAAREDEAYFLSMNEPGYAETARFWQAFFTDTLNDFEALNRNLTAAFRGFHERGLLEIITCAATHGYMPLLGTDESLRAQVRVAIATHQRHLGHTPRGMWIPECGYRPAGFWNFPIEPDGQPTAGSDRIGVEQALTESGIDFFFVDTHLVEQGARIASPYERQTHTTEQTSDPRSLYQPYFVEGPGSMTSAATVFPRDPRTGLQVWSGDNGYPGDANYLDFHKKRWPGGHRYWRVTAANVDMADKQPYSPAVAAERVREHASHFVSLVAEALAPAQNGATPPILSSPFDAELFGHWWFEGPQWLEAVVRAIHDRGNDVALCSGSEYLDQYPRAGFLSMHEGSWGAEGTNHVWLNPETTWTYAQLYPAELYLRDLATAGLWKSTPTLRRITQQLCRELLLMESSDWQFLITTGAARDYAELRFQTHLDYFNELRSFADLPSLTPEREQRLAEIEQRDSIFPGIDPAFWVLGAKAQREAPPVLSADSDSLAAISSGFATAASTDASTSELPKFVSTDLA